MSIIGWFAIYMVASTGIAVLVGKAIKWSNGGGEDDGSGQR